MVSIHEKSCLGNFKKSEFLYSFPYILFYGTHTDAFLLILDQKAHVSRTRVLLLCHSHAILISGYLVRIAKDLFVAVNLQE